MSELRLNTDGHIIKFGADNDVSLTHVEDTGLLLNSTMQLQFNDASQNINAPSATVLDINATDEIELNATAVDLNGTLDVSGLITANANITLAGTTPTLTIGDAGAEDAKLVFDGNAQDYHIGLDDTDDSLKIGLGSTLGTTSHIVIDSTGAVTKPLQPAFSAQCNADLTNIGTDNAFNTIKNGTEIFDLNGDYNTSTFAFTAPVTGKYMLTFSATLTNVDSACTFIVCTIVTSNRNYGDGNHFAINGYSADEPRYEIGQTVLADMDSGDTALIQVKQHEGTAQMDVTDDTCFFSGYLAC